MSMEIIGGIEWFCTDDVNGMTEECQCARCGGEAEWLRCANCDDGLSYHDCGEDCCCCVEPEPNVRCDWCSGTGGSWHCANTPTWCEANPLRGREHITSTALRAEAWNDV
jgi:hypothetical protein